MHRVNGTTEVAMTERDTMAGPTVPNDRKGVGQRDGLKTCGNNRAACRSLVTGKEAERDPLKLNAHSKVSECELLTFGWL